MRQNDLETAATTLSRRHPAIRAVQALNVAFGRGYHGLRLMNACPLPTSGPAILICNHTSGLDPCLLQAASSRLITWMMAREYYELPIVRTICRISGMIPTSRNGRDVAAMRTALRALEEGAIVGIFPEGRIETDGQLLPFHPGVAMLALRAGAPVYPARLEGSQRGRSMTSAFLMPGRSQVRFGPPVELAAGEPTRQALGIVTERFRAAIAGLDLYPTRSSNIFRAPSP